jgi:hypothetical protein
VTRRAGLVAIDSKWRNSTTDGDLAEMATSARKAQLRLQGIMQGVIRDERGRHRDGGRHVQVTPLVVVWGAQGRHVPHDYSLDGVRFVAGTDLVRWLKSAVGDEVDRERARVVLDGVEQFREQVWDRQSSKI